MTTNMISDTKRPNLVEEPPPPPMATPDERAELLRQLRVRRRGLVNAYAVGQ